MRQKKRKRWDSFLPRPAPFRSKNRNQWSVSLTTSIAPTSPTYCHSTQYCNLRGLFCISPTSSHSFLFEGPVPSGAPRRLGLRGLLLVPEPGRPTTR